MRFRSAFLAAGLALAATSAATAQSTGPAGTTGAQMPNTTTPGSIGGAPQSLQPTDPATGTGLSAVPGQRYGAGAARSYEPNAALPSDAGSTSAGTSSGEVSGGG